MFRKRSLLLLLAPLVLIEPLCAALAPEYEAVRRAEHESEMLQKRAEAEVVFEGRVIEVNKATPPARPEMTERWVDQVVLTVEVRAVRRGESLLGDTETVVVEYTNVFYGGGWAGPVQYRPRRLEVGEIATFFLNPTHPAEREPPTFSLAAGDMSFVESGFERIATPPEPRWRSRPHRPWWRHRR